MRETPEIRAAIERARAAGTLKEVTSRSIYESMTEEQFQKEVICAARSLGWKVAHFRKARRQSGKWSTPVAADGAGFPDLVIAKDGWVIFAELKTQRGVLKSHQNEWLKALAPRSRLWRPDDWMVILNTLRHPETYLRLTDERTVQAAEPQEAQAPRSEAEGQTAHQAWPFAGW